MGLSHRLRNRLIGSTSEDVEAQLEQALRHGRGDREDINLAIRNGVANGLGIGESLGPSSAAGNRNSES